jgi:Tfp pilus assembly protein PilF
MYEAAQDSRTDYLVGLYDVARGKLSTAERSMSRSVNSPSEALPIYYLWAGCLKEAIGDKAGAVEEWRAARARDYFMRKGDSFFSRGDYADALREYSIVVRIEPTFADGWLGVAASQQNLATVNHAQWSDMLISAQTALALAPQDPQAHYLVGYGLWLSGGDAREAELQLRWALNKRAYWGDAYSLGRMLLDQGVADEPTALMQKALSLKSDNDEVRAQLVRAYLAEGQCAAAQQEARRALERNPAQQERLRQICDAYNACKCIFD